MTGFRSACGVVVPVGGVVGGRAAGRLGGRSVVGGFAALDLAAGLAQWFGGGAAPGFAVVGPWVHHPDPIVASHGIAGIRQGECIAVACRFGGAAPAGVVAHHHFGGAAAMTVAAAVVAAAAAAPAAWPPRGLGWADHNDLP